MAKRENQVATKKIKYYLESKGFNKAEIARKANIKPDDLYAMLDNLRIMSVDEFACLCIALDVSADEVLKCEYKSTG